MRTIGSSFFFALSLLLPTLAGADEVNSTLVLTPTRADTLAVAPIERPDIFRLAKGEGALIKYEREVRAPSEERDRLAAMRAMVTPRTVSTAAPTLTRRQAAHADAARSQTTRTSGRTTGRWGR